MHQDPESGNSQFELTGRFWSADTPDASSSGRVVFAAWESPVLHLDDAIVIQRTIQVRGVATRISGDPDDIVEDFRPVTICGATEDGQKITLLGAQGGARDFGTRQQYRAKTALVGDYYPDSGATFSSVRYQLDNSSLWSHLGEQSRNVENAYGRLALDGNTGDWWLNFTPSTPMTLRDHGRRVLIASRTLARLALQKEIVIGRAQVRENGDSAWLAWYSQTTASERVSRYVGDWLVQPEAISLQHLCDWLPLSARLDGLDAAIADANFSDNLELRALTLGTIAEGLHRRLFDKDVRFKGLGKASRRAVRSTGKDAISASINGFGFDTVPEDFDDLLGGLNDVSLKDRMITLQNYAEEAVPTVVENIVNWPGLVANVRNYLAHWLLEEDVTHVPTVDERLLAFMSLPWVLRTVLLRQANVDQSLMRDGYSESGEFPIYLANMRVAAENL